MYSAGPSLVEGTNRLTSKCNLCGMGYKSDDIWKNKGEQFCSGCTTLKILELTYRGIPPEVEEEVIKLSGEIEKLDDRKQEDESLPLVKQALSMIDNMVVPERICGLVTGGVYWFNEAMKRDGRFENTGFIQERNWMSTKLTYMVVIFYQKKKPIESWKWFIGTVPKH